MLRDVDVRHHLLGGLGPRQGRLRLHDYEKVFCPDPASDDIFELRGVDRESGCIVVVRPDQYVAHVLPLDAYEQLDAFFGGILIATSRGGSRLAHA